MEILLSTPNLFYIIAILFLVLLSAFFSGTETAIVSANRIRLESLATKGKKSAIRSLAILDNIEEAISFMLIGNNIANITATAFVTYVATRAFFYNESELIIVTALQTVLFLIVCEVSPKIVARFRADRHLMFFSGLIMFLMVMIKPVIKASLVFSRYLKKIMNIEDSGRSLAMSRDEIDIFFKLGIKHGLIDEDHHFLVSEILSFRDTTAMEVLTPTIDIVSIEIEQNIRDLVDIITATKYSRIPVYEKRVDNIVGYVLYRDILKNRTVREIREIINEAYYVPATKKMNDLYMEMVKWTVPMVFVVNEYGAVIGMVTHEDIAEEVVGEIQTRDHFHDNLITKITDKKFFMDANLNIDFFKRLFNLHIEKKGFETVAGFLEYLTGKIPKKGDRIDYDNLSFIVEDATARSIEKITLLITNKKKKK